MVARVALGNNTSDINNSNVVLRSSLNKKNGLKLCCFNSESLYPKLDYIKLLLDGVHMDVICVTESWLKPHISDGSVNIPGFNIFRNDRIQKRGGGICIYVKSSVVAKEIYSMSRPNLEISLLELIIQNIRVLLVVVYKPPRMEYCDALEEILNNYSLAYSNIILCGDFNQDLLKPVRASKFLGLLSRYDLTVHNTEPTYFCCSSSSLLDLVITNNNRLTFINQVSMGWKHDFLFFAYDIGVDPAPVFRQYRDFKNIDLDNLFNYCSMLPWDDVYSMSDVDIQIGLLNELTLSALENCVPIRTVSVRHTKPPWIDNEVIDAISMRNFAHHLWKCVRNDTNWKTFKILRNRVCGLVRKKKSAYLLKELDPKLPSAKFWKNVKKLGINDSKPKIDPTISPSDFLLQFSDHAAADDVGSQVGSSDFNINLNEGEFAFRNINLLEFQNALIGVRSNAIGLDGISLDFIKLILPVTGKYFLHVFNYILTTSMFPKCWKNAKIVPIPKTASPSSTADYRPISILPALSKVFEKILQKQLSTYLVKEELINKYQSAYRSNHGTNHALLNIVDDIRRSADKKESTVLVLLDFSKAFDTINHKLLIKKLNDNFKLTSSACNLIRSYLSDRSSVVHYNSAYSEKIAVKRGVPQGSIMGPLLFSLYINDLPLALQHCHYHLFADDVQIYLSCPPEKIHENITQINSDIEAITKWSNENGLTLNIGKTQAIVIYKTKINTSELPCIFMQNEVVPFSDKVKDLGLLISKDLNWIDQINTISKRVNFMLRSLWTVTKHASAELKRKLFLSFIFPHFLYCDVIMFGMFEYNFNKIQLLFNACVRYIYGLRKYDHISRFSNEVLGCSIREYYVFRVCLLIFKLLKVKEPDFLYCKLQRLPSVRSNNLLVPRNTIDIFNKSFFVRGITLYNSLPSAVKNSHSQSTFKRNYFLHN